MKPALCFLASLGLCWSSSQCSSLHPQPKPKSEEKTDKPKPAEAPKLIGRIASIPRDKSFVLIQSYGKWNVPPGTILTTRGPEHRTANLLATGESLGEFAAADLQSGSLEIGDAVFSSHVPKPAENEAANPTTAPPQPAAENVQKNN